MLSIILFILLATTVGAMVMLVRYMKDLIGLLQTQVDVAHYDLGIANQKVSDLHSVVRAWRVKAGREEALRHAAEAELNLARRATVKMMEKVEASR